MAQLAIAAGSAAIGFAIGGPTGAQIGWAIGSSIGGSLTTQRIQGPMSSDLKAPKVQYGAQWPRIYGRQRVAGMLLWASDKRAIANVTEEGGKGGPTVESTTYTYEIDILYGLAIESEVFAITRVWRAGDLIYSALRDAGGTSHLASATTDAWAEITLFDGNASQDPWSVYEAAVGVDDALAYRHRATVGIEALNLGGSDQLPLLEFEVVTAGTGTIPVVYHDEFTASIASYTLDSGDASNFQQIDTPYGGGLYGFGRASGTVDRITRSFSALTDVRRVEFWFYVGSPSTDDAMTFALLGSGVQRCGINPRREASFDSLQRAHFSYGGATYALGSGALAIGDWHHAELTIDVDGSEVNVVITDANGTTVISQLLTTTATPMAIDSLTVSIDASGVATADTTYADLYVYQSEGIEPETVDLADIVQAECELAGLDPALLDVTDLVGTEVRGIGGTGTARQLIEALMAGYYFDWFCADKLRAVLRGGSPVATVAFDDLSAGIDAAEETAFDPQRANDGEVPARVALTAVNLNADYEDGTQMGDRLVSVGGGTQQARLPLVLLPEEIKGRALAMALDARNASITAQISLSELYAKVGCTDAIIVPDIGGTTYRMRVLRETYADGVKALELCLDDPTALITAGIASDERTPAITVPLPIETRLWLFSIPILRDADDTPGFMAAFAPSVPGSWPGAALFRSVDNITFSSVVTATDRAIAGTGTELSDWAGGHRFDEANSITVTVNGALSSSTRAAMYADRTINVMAVGAHGRWEIIRFRTATLVSVGVYKLTGLLRGHLGTEWAMGLHEAGDTVVLLRTTGLRRFEHGSADIGLARYYKAPTLGRPVTSATAEAFTDDGAALKPRAPIDPRASRDSGDITITWRRRTRLQTRYLGPLAASVPLGEAAEAYSIDVMDGGDVVRTLTSTTAAVIYTSAEQTADGFTPGDPVGVRIYQISATVGRGYALEATV
jgi:Putative phage tail protein